MLADRRLYPALIGRPFQVFNTKVPSGNQIDYESVKEAFDDMFCLIAVWIAMTAAIAEDFLKKSLEKLEDAEKRKDVVDEFVLNNAYLYQDAAKILGW